MTSIFRMLIEGAWRRRMMIIAPIVVLTSIGLAAALLLPRTYESQALILLQEDGGRSALTARGQSRQDEIVARVNAFGALLNSENLLSRVLLDVGAVQPGDDITMALEIEELRGRLSIEPVGAQFIALRLRGAEPYELQAYLTGILTRAFEALLLPTAESASAPEFLIRQLRRELEVAEAELASFDDDSMSATELLSIQGERTAAANAADRLTSEIETARAALTAAVRAVDPTRAEVLRPSREVDRVEGLLGELRGAADPDQSAISAAQGQLAAYQALISDEERLSRLRLDLAEAQRIVAEADQRLSASQAIEGRRAEVDARIRAISTQLQSIPSQFQSGAGQSLNILRAPEQMQIIDPPSLPNRPVRGALLILVVGIAGGVAFGCGLALVAEQLDQSLRTIEDLEGLVERPAIARLPKLPGAAIDHAISSADPGDPPPPLDDDDDAAVASAAIRAVETRSNRAELVSL